MHLSPAAIEGAIALLETRSSDQRSVSGEYWRRRENEA